MLLLALAALVRGFEGDESDSLTWESDIPDPTATYSLSNAPVIAGAVCGALAGIMAIVMITFYCCQRRHKKDLADFQPIN